MLMILVQHYLYLTETNKLCPATFSDEQSSVLLPVFTPQERFLQEQTIRSSPSRIVRTCYQSAETYPEDQARHQWLLDEYTRWEGRTCRPEQCNESGSSVEFLDNANLYAFGDDYEEIFRRCPDLLWQGHGLCRVDRYLEDIEGVFNVLDILGKTYRWPEELCELMAVPSLIN